MENSDERWLPVKNYEGIYEVSNKGRVKSLSREVIRGRIRGVTSEKILSPSLSGDKVKYLSVLLSKGGKKVKKKIHHLVLEAFCGPKPFSQAVARHLDDNPLKNTDDNLVWGTSSENTKDKFKNGYISPSRKLTIEQTQQIKSDSRSQRILAKEYGVSQRTIFRIKNREGSYYETNQK